MNNRHSGSHQATSPGGQPAHPSHRSQPSFGGPVPIPTGQANGGGRERNSSLMGQQQYDMGKSPPNLSNKNTKHVPCKFFRSGQCQAGAACPFLHTMDPMSHQAPCKYFMKGNCKFGAKCALAHYLPNGHRVSKADLEPINGRRYPVNGQDDLSPFPHHDPALQEPFLGPPPPNPGFFPDIPFLDDDYDPNPEKANIWTSNTRGYEAPIGSPPTSQFGSPPNDAFSPAKKWPSALNAPLPASYNNSLPNYAKFGPLGASVPDKFGLGSPANSSSSQKLGSPPSREPATRGLTQPPTLKTPPLGASPAHAESSIGERIMHSQRNVPRSRFYHMSSSVPVHELDATFSNFEADLSFVPSDLHDEVLTPGEKIQRLSSKSDQDPIGSFRNRSEGLAIPRRPPNVVGSPPGAGSPSRFRALFEEQQKEKASNAGVVGSPLRESWMLDGNSSISNRQAVPMSGISQAMARMELNRNDSSEANGLRPAGFRGSYARQISSPGLSSKRIDEEGEGAFFPMDDESKGRANPAWIENQSTSSARTSEEQSRGSSNRPTFGFNP